MSEHVLHLALFKVELKLVREGILPSVHSEWQTELTGFGSHESTGTCDFSSQSMFLLQGHLPPLPNYWDLDGVGLCGVILLLFNPFFKITFT